VRPEADDTALLRRAAAGDESALAILYDRHAGWLLVRLSRRCAIADLVDQALQDTFLAVWRQAGRYRGDGDVSAFIWGDRDPPADRCDPQGRRPA
jgi:RNA polymerase sigma-70 factor, ECF subfamily